jgi:hypothetical protein
MSDECLLCGEVVQETDERAEGRWFDMDGVSHKVHRECALREVLGGIGHLTDHNYWCVVKGDPNGGVSYRESAKAVDSWVRQNGVPA